MGRLLRLGGCRGGEDLDGRCRLCLIGRKSEVGGSRGITDK